MFQSLLKQSVSVRDSRWLECCVVTMAVLSVGTVSTAAVCGTVVFYGGCSEEGWL